jgi:hypothetical protein
MQVYLLFDSKHGKRFPPAATFRFASGAPTRVFVTRHRQPTEIQCFVRLLRQQTHLIADMFNGFNN